MRKAAVRVLMTRAAGGARALDRGSDLVNQVTSSASEFLRTRRDASVIAERRRRAARRRVTSWSAVSAVSAGALAIPVTTMVTGGVSGGAVFAAVVLFALLFWAVVNLTRAAADLRARTRVVRSLPPVQPARPAVAPAVRPDIDRLDGYSDGLRHLVGMIGAAGPGPDDPTTVAMRNDTLGAADAAEARLRRQAAELTGLLRTRSAAPAEARARLDTTAADLHLQITAGVAAYGELVTAASETVAASRELAAGAPTPDSDLRYRTERLQALAIGMRELTGE